MNVHLLGDLQEIEDVKPGSLVQVHAGGRTVLAVMATIRAYDSARLIDLSDPNNSGLPTAFDYQVMLKVPRVLNLTEVCRLVPEFEGGCPLSETENVAGRFVMTKVGNDTSYYLSVNMPQAGIGWLNLNTGVCIQQIMSSRGWSTDKWRIERLEEGKWVTLFSVPTP